MVPSAAHNWEHDKRFVLADSLPRWGLRLRQVSRIRRDAFGGGILILLVPVETGAAELTTALLGRDGHREERGFTFDR